MGEELLEIRVAGGPDASAEETDRLVTDLREELLELDVQAVEPVPAGPLPAGAKGMPAADVASLAVALSDSAAAATLVVTLRSWSARNKRRKVSIRLGEHELAVDDVSAEDATALIKSWIELHGQRRT